MSQQKQNHDYLDKLLALWMAFMDRCAALVRQAKTALRQIPFKETGSKIKQGWQNLKAKCGEAARKAKPYFKDVKLLVGKIGSVLKSIVHWIWKLRKVIMAIPVVWMAVKLALENADRLPEMVGLDIQSTGEFAHMVSRDVAVYGPLAITGFCLLLMFCSRKTLLPWLISIFTLVLPFLIYLTNYYA